MKKSKFLKSSKDMLSRSFNPSKCKTSLRLASSRLKLLRNKKEAQVKQIRREISLLLESGQDQTARIRVEHVIREEKMMAAFDLIEIYCELIVARLPIIESQKICPIDLKEAITTVVFAAPRCGDVPELVEIKKHFTEKYGKDFITAAVELRPNCGVSRILVEKLSAVAPDIQTKVKILNEIAKEHNVQWDGESIDKNPVPTSDSLTGSSAFVKENQQPVEPSHFQGPDIKAHDPLETERLVSGINTAFQHEANLRALGGEREKLSRDGYSIPNDRPRWNMEFKDATSAAQAAAESAEMASMAARAAAELSRRDSLTSHYSTESPHSLRDGAPDTYMRSNMVSQQFSKDSINRPFSEDSRLQNEQIDRENFNVSGGRFDSRKEYSRSSSSESKTSIKDDSMHHSGDRYSRKNSLNEVAKSVQSRSFKKGIEKQESSIYSHPRSSISNNVDISSNFGKEGIYEEPFEKSYNGSAVVFDKSDSDIENDGFDIYDEPQQVFQSPLSSQKSKTESWSPKSSTSHTVKPSPSEFLTRKSSDFHERSIDGSKVDDSVSLAFDESDRQTSESEEEVKDSRHFFGERRQLVGLLFKDKSRPPSGTLHRGAPLFDQTQSSESEVDSERNQGKKFDADPPAKLNIGKPSAAFAPKNNQTALNIIGNNSPEREEGLNFGKLTGGFRHKGHNYPSFVKNKTNFKETTDSSSSSEEDSLQENRLYTLSGGKDLKTKPTFAASDSVFGLKDSDLDEDLPTESVSRTRRLHSGISRRTKAPPSDHGKEKLSKMQLRSEALDIDDDDMDRKATTSTSSETPKPYETRRNSSKFGLEPAKTNFLEPQESSNSEGTSSVLKQRSKVEIRSEAHDSHDSKEQKPTMSYSQQQMNSTQLRNAHLPSSSRAATGSLYEYNSPTKQESTVSYGREEASLPQRNTTKQENLKAKTLSKTPSNNDSSNQKASHVHPKLPDYDDFLQFFKKNRS